MRQNDFNTVRVKLKNYFFMFIYFFIKYFLIVDEKFANLFSFTFFFHNVNLM